ncbi:hypothetical protein DOTSEDRAFT_52993, partial [Dothistroma septosporum NZE10]
AKAQLTCCTLATARVDFRTELVQFPYWPLPEVLQIRHRLKDGKNKSKATRYSHDTAISASPVDQSAETRSIPARSAYRLRHRGKDDIDRRLACTYALHDLGIRAARSFGSLRACWW